jgi:hypothetical protein
LLSHVCVCVRKSSPNRKKANPHQPPRPFAI